jgi:hypothetical protein
VSKRVRGTAEAAKSKFPREIYVRREEDTDGSFFLLADEGIDAADDGEAIAVYELKEVQRKSVEHRLL